MPRRTKILAITIIVVAGVAGAWLFRKAEPVEAVAPESQAAQAAPAAPRADLRPEPEKPPPTSHLTGRIEPSGDGSSMGLSSSSVGSGGFSPLAPLPDQAATSAAGGPISAVPGTTFNEQTRHKIADGDTLSGLAQRYLGSADRYHEIFELNRDLLSDENLLPIGAELRIPARGSPLAAPRPMETQPMVPVSPRPPISSPPEIPAAAAPMVPTATPVTYRVEHADTLSGIAKKIYGDAGRYRELLTANRDQLRRPEDLREGAVLVIP